MFLIEFEQYLIECLLMQECLLSQACSPVRRPAGYAVRHQKRFDLSSRGMNDISVGAEDFGAQGGGGWYGGGGSCFAGCAGGGSSHGNTSLLISNSYKTIDGAHEMPSPDGGTETGHSGHGACVISWILK